MDYKEYGCIGVDYRIARLIRIPQQRRHGREDNLQQRLRRQHAEDADQVDPPLWVLGEYLHPRRLLPQQTLRVSRQPGTADLQILGYLRGRLASSLLLAAVVVVVRFADVADGEVVWVVTTRILRLRLQQPLPVIIATLRVEMLRH